MVHLAGRIPGCRTAAAAELQITALTEGEGADATSLQTQAYEASASPIFWPVSCPGAGQRGEVAFGGNRSVDVNECSKLGRRSFTFLPPPRSWRRKR